MNSFDRYIVRTTFGAYLLILVSLTAVIWLTHALREIDLMTNQGQTILVFIGITGLLVPMLVLVIGPISLVVAIAHTLNRLNTDSEIVVMNASGMSPWRIFRPFLITTIIVSIMIGFLSAYLAPKGLRELRNWAMRVRADLVTNILQPGRFTTVENGLTFHLRERRPDGQLMGVFIDDRRDPKERATFLAEYGEIVENERGNFLVLMNGSVQRIEPGKSDPTIVVFERYAFDLSRFNTGPQIATFGVRERDVWDLMFPDPEDPVYKSIPTQFRAELHDRLAAPIYPVAFTVICFAILGAPRTSRQSRSMSAVMALGAVGGLRLTGMACNVFAAQTVVAIYVLWISIVLNLGVGIFVIARGANIEPPEFVTKSLAALAERFAPRQVAAT